MFALIKLPFKLLSLPLMAVFSIMAFLVKILSNLSGYVLMIRIFIYSPL